MSRYIFSRLQQAYSDWHLGHNDDLLKDCYMTDIDKLWVEVRRSEPVAVFDLKWGPFSDSVTVAEKIVYKWFIQKGLPVYVITPDKYDGKNGAIVNGSDWYITDYSIQEKKKVTEEEFCSFLKSL